MHRRMYCAFQRKWKDTLAVIALLLAIGAVPATGAEIDVNENCSLVNAITSANTDEATGGCTAGNGEDTINLIYG